MRETEYFFFFNSYNVKISTLFVQTDISGPITVSSI